MEWYTVKFGLYDTPTYTYVIFVFGLIYFSNIFFTFFLFVDLLSRFNWILASAKKIKITSVKDATLTNRTTHTD